MRRIDSLVSGLMIAGLLTPSSGLPDQKAPLCVGVHDPRGVSDSDGRRVEQWQIGFLNGQKGNRLEVIFPNDARAYFEPSQVGPVDCPNSSYYVVGQGDTFSKIAAIFAVSPDDLQRVNPQIGDVNKIFPGERLNLPLNITASFSAESGIEDGWYEEVAKQGTLVRIKPEGRLAILEGGAFGSDFKWRAKLVYPDHDFQNKTVYTNLDQVEEVIGEESLGDYLLPPKFHLGANWLEYSEGELPLYVVYPLRRVYLRTSSLLGEPKFPIVIERTTFGPTEYGQIFYGADWGIIWINKEVDFVKMAGNPSLRLNMEDCLTHEMGHQRLIGWSGNAHQGLAESLAWVTGDKRTGPAWFNFYQIYKKSGNLFFLEQKYQDFIYSAALFYEVEMENPGFLAYWASKTDELRLRSADPDKPVLTRQEAQKWMEEFKPGLWEKFQKL